MIDTVKYTLLLIATLLLCGCGNRNSRPSAISETEQIVEQVDSLPRVFINYNQLVNGYKVTATWFPWGAIHSEVGHGILKFVHTTEKPKYGPKNQEFYVFNPYFSDPVLDSLAYTDHAYKNGDTFNLDYTPPRQGELIGHNTPFQFLDVDFDGEEELLINNWRCGHRDWNTYDVYKVEAYHAEKLTGGPFDYLEDGDNFDYRKKTITQLWSNGWNDYERRVYKRHASPHTAQDVNEEFYNPIQLDSLFKCDNGHMTVYARQRDKLILIDEYDIE
jgi:hypothetical protein